jgi:hypothetical protein
MASAAHTYGKPILGAEAFTADDRERWLDHPATIKSLGDRAFCDGVNRFVFHRYALQPWPDQQPGMTMGPWGVHYERTQTWWEWTPGWHEYLARSQFLLRQGLFVADLCYLQQETAPQGFQSHNPKGYDYDNCSAEVVLTRMTAQDGRLVLPDGMSYRLLVLPEVETMTPALLRKIKELVQTGATVLGPRPLRSPSLTDYPKCDEEVKRLADELWGRLEAPPSAGSSAEPPSSRTPSGDHSLGQGRVVWGVAPEKILAQMDVQPDFSSRPRLRYIHRRAGDTEIYFVANPQPHDVQGACAFRVQGKRPELWWPDSGRIERAAMFDEQRHAINLSMHMDAHGSVFVVFRPSHEPLDPIAVVTRDGKSILPVAQSAPKIVVQKAVYGVLRDPQRTRDVRAQAQRIADSGEDSFTVSQLAQDGDPAHGIVKTLVIEYTVGGQRITVTGQDPDTVYLPDYAPKIVVEKAVYGVLGDAKRTRDVRAKLQRLVDAGQYSFQVARMAEGDDPAFLVVKTLVVDYILDGKHVTAQGTDPETLSLAQPPAVTVERMVEVRHKPDGQLFIEARQPGRYELKTVAGRSHVVEAPPLPKPVELDGPWEIRFPPNCGAPAKLTFNELTDWSKHHEAGVKFFSGTATYLKRFTVPVSFQSAIGDQQSRIYLELGKVAVMAQVKLNGQDLGVLWKAPFCVDVTGVIRAGENELEIKVVNLWVNRMLGDEQLPEDSDRNPDGTLKAWPSWLQEGKPSPTGRFTFTSWRLWKKDSALRESGLLGPVRLVAAREIQLKKYGRVKQ